MSAPFSLLHRLQLGIGKTEKDKLAQWVAEDPVHVAALLEIFLGDDTRLVQRAAWVLLAVGQKMPELLVPWYPKMLAKLREPNVHDAAKRNVVRYFEDADIPDEILDELTDICFLLLSNLQEPIAIRAFCMTVLAKICRRVPELAPELRLLIEEQLPHASPAIRNRGLRILTQLSKK